jgi:hypothetical protein
MLHALPVLTLCFSPSLTCSLRPSPSPLYFQPCLFPSTQSVQIPSPFPTVTSSLDPPSLSSSCTLHSHSPPFPLGCANYTQPPLTPFPFAPGIHLPSSLTSRTEAWPSLRVIVFWSHCFRHDLATWRPG